MNLSLNSEPHLDVVIFFIALAIGLEGGSGDEELGLGAGRVGAPERM